MTMFQASANRSLGSPLIVKYSRALIVLIASWFLAQFAESQEVTKNSDVSETLGISKVKPAAGPFVEIDGGKGGYMVPYVHSLERTNIHFEMIPIPGGKVLVGSPESEADRTEDEGPQYSVTLEPYWVAKTELTWGEYKTFMKSYDIFKRLASGGVRKVDDSNRADAITVPTPLYQASHTFEYGDDNKQPAVTMTQYSAKQYTKWLSGLSGIQYRLPTEAEWEHAARAGSTTTYSFGDDANKIDDFAVHSQTKGAAKVGSKLPNAFGLHDMHGNVWEWTIDQYSPTGFGDRGGKSFVGLAGTGWATQADSRCVRGGGWQDGPDRLRSAVRMGSADESWKEEDPNIPLSPWWYTSDPARMVGMRLVRSAKPLSNDELKKFWEIDATAIQEDVDSRLREGRGATGLPVPELLKSYQRKK
jgi:formylglycine-generating enzyme